MGIGENIKLYRELNNMSQSELSKILGVSDKTISSWEINRTEPKMGMIEKICSALNCKKTDIIGNDEGIDIKQNTDITQFLINHFGPAAEGMIMFSELDLEDRAEIKGEMRQMLKSDKYQTKDIYKNA